MLKKCEPPLILAILPSARLKQCLGIFHVLALIACMANTLPLVFKMALMAGIAVHYGFIHKRVLNQCHTIRHTDVFGWQIGVDGQFEAMQVLDTTVLTRFVIFLHYKYQNTVRCNIAIPCDALTADDYRQFMVRLKTTRAK
jgi:hypothetical protein